MTHAREVRHQPTPPFILLDALSKHGRNACFVVDRDSTSQKVFAPEKLKANGVRPEQIHYVGNPNEIEETFTDVQWTDAANRAWPRVDEEPWTTTHFSTLRNGGKFSTSVEAMVRPAARTAPSGKPGYLYALVEGLEHSDEVPEQLRELFQHLMNLANPA